MERMRIALSGSPQNGFITVKPAYLDAIWEFGGIPTLLSPRTDDEYVNEVVNSFDGFLFCGGVDIDPSYYGEEINGSENICSLRDEFEKKLFDAAYKSGKPILGICRGMQVINVFLGGSLHQHIENHSQDEGRGILTHGVTVNEGGLLHKIEGRGHIEVNSFHHQVVNVLAPCLDIDGSSDGDVYIEAFHHKDHPFLLGVQWHPEDYFKESETSGKIFEEFIGACRE